MADNKKEELREIAKSMLPDSIIVIGYLEHQLDLIGRLVLDLFANQTSLSADVQSRLNDLNQLLQYSSIDFSNITSQLESYKIPNATALKEETRKIQKKYLDAQIREGLFN